MPSICQREGGKHYMGRSACGEEGRVLGGGWAPRKTAGRSGAPRASSRWLRPAACARRRSTRAAGSRRSRADLASSRARARPRRTRAASHAPPRATAAAGVSSGPAARWCQPPPPRGPRRRAPSRWRAAWSCGGAAAGRAVSAAARVRGAAAATAGCAARRAACPAVRRRCRRRSCTRSGRWTGRRAARPARARARPGEMPRGARRRSPSGRKRSAIAASAQNASRSGMW
jgi:hypothetical protein